MPTPSATGDRTAPERQHRECVHGAAQERLLAFVDRRVPDRLGEVVLGLRASHVEQTERRGHGGLQGGGRGSLERRKRLDLRGIADPSERGNRIVLERTFALGYG